MMKKYVTNGKNDLKIETELGNICFKNNSFITVRKRKQEL